MTEKDKTSFGNDDFWNLDEYAKKKTPSYPIKQFSKSATEAVEISSNIETNREITRYSDNKLSPSSENNSTITRFIPPHKDSIYAKKHVLMEYAPKNPLIKSVRICADKEGDKLFPESNLFMRERRALLNRRVSECSYTPYYSFSPRYSQMSRAQLAYYVWWRENARNGNFLKADESYIILYTYELAATGDGEDKPAALNMLCALLTNYQEPDINAVFRMMIRDIICDFCLVHNLSLPLEKLKSLKRQLISNAYIPEFFIDLSEESRDTAVEIGLPAISMYDFRKSKFYTPELKSDFKKAMGGAMAAVFADRDAFNSIISFTGGVYGHVTAERRPFGRMVGIANKSIRLEITYYQLSNIQSTVTDAMRHAENRFREHIGVKNKLHLTAIKPALKAAIDAYFDSNFPPMPVVDRRRKNATEQENEVHEYDKLYDVPKAELSPERALEIERESWSTTRILTEAFADEIDEVASISVADKSSPQPICEPISEKKEPEALFEMPFTATSTQSSSSAGLYMQIRESIGDFSAFIDLCRSPSPTAQRAFALSHGLSLDELADRINEAAVDIFGDILLEDVGGSYGILEDYLDQL